MTEVNEEGEQGDDHTERYWDSHSTHTRTTEEVNSALTPQRLTAADEAVD